MSKPLNLVIRYLSSGLVATLVHIIVFACLLPYSGPVFSTFYAGVSGALVAYFLARHWVFSRRHCNGVRFSITVASQIASNTLIVTVLVKWGTHPYLAQLSAMAVATSQGLMINHLWVFKHDT